MQRCTAKTLIDLLARHLGEQDEVLAAVRVEEPHDEVLRIRTMIVRTMGAIVLDGLNPLLAEHPGPGPAHSR